MGADNSKPPKYIEKINSSKYTKQIDPFDNIKETNQGKIQSTKLMPPNFLKMLYQTHGKELFNILQDKNIKVELEDIKNGILEIIIKNDEVELFKKVLNLTNDPKTFLNETFKDRKIFEHIYGEYAWKIIEEIFQYVDLAYTSNNYISGVIVGQTILHMACWSNKYDLIKKIITTDKDILFIADSKGFTPLHMLLIGSYFQNHNPAKHSEIYSLICSTYNLSQLLKLFEHTTTQKYKRSELKYKKDITIPAGSSFANIVEIVKSLETPENQKIITENNGMITEHILKQMSDNNSKNVQIIYS